MAGRRRNGRLITRHEAERLAREGRLHGPDYDRALREESRHLREIINPARKRMGLGPVMPDAYGIHLREARISADRAGQAVRDAAPLVWQEIEEIQALGRRYGHYWTPEWQRELDELRRFQAARRARNPEAYAREAAATKARRRRSKKRRR